MRRKISHLPRECPSDECGCWLLWPVTLTDAIVAYVVWSAVSRNQKTSNFTLVNKRHELTDWKKRLHKGNPVCRVGEECSRLGIGLVLSSLLSPALCPVHLKPQGTGNVRDCSDMGDVPGDPVVKTLCFHCRGQRFDPWFGELGSSMLCSMTTNQIFFKKRHSSYHTNYLQRTRSPRV